MINLKSNKIKPVSYSYDISSIENTVEYYKILIEDYKNYRGKFWSTNEWYIDYHNYIKEHELEDAIKLSVFSRNRQGKIDNHQRRIKLS